MNDAGPSGRAAVLAQRLREAASGLLAVIELVDADRWQALPAPGVWSISKDAEHVADAAAFHQWIVRLTIGEKIASRRPAVERAQATSAFTPVEAMELIRRSSDESLRLISGLTDEQLSLVTRPPRARGERLAETIDRVLIGHYDVHRIAIEQKLRMG